jgi:hypothetical protein
MTVKPLSFSEALAAVKKADSNGDGRRFVETGEGLEVEARAPAAAKPKLVPIEDILLDMLEEDEGGEAGGADAEEGADES